MPRISVVMPVYNSEKFVGEAIESLLEQTFEDFEIIVIDDKSKDESAEVISRYKDPRIKFIKSSENKGFLYELNYGISLATGEYIARLDDDDISYPTRLAKQIAYMDKNPEVVLLGTHIDYLIEGKITKVDLCPIKTPEEHKFSLLFDNFCIAHSSFMMRKKVLIDNNIQYKDFLQTPDYHMLLNLSAYGKIAMLEEALGAWRIHPNQSTQIRTHTMKVDEEDRTRCVYINSLPLEEKEKSILEKCILRSLYSKEDYKELKKAMIHYAQFCKMPTSLEHLKRNECYKFVFRKKCMQQKHNMHLLKIYLSSDFKDVKWLYSRGGIEFIIKCIISYNKNWYGPVEKQES